MRSLQANQLSGIRHRRSRTLPLQNGLSILALQHQREPPCHFRAVMSEVITIPRPDGYTSGGGKFAPAITSARLLPNTLFQLSMRSVYRLHISRPLRPLPVYDPLPCIMIWARHQSAFRLFTGLLHFRLAYLYARLLETLTTMQAPDKCADTIAQAMLFTPPPMARRIQDDAMLTLPARDTKISLVQRALEQRADWPVVFFTRHPAIRRLPAHLTARGTS